MLIVTPLVVSYFSFLLFFVLASAHLIYTKVVSRSLLLLLCVFSAFLPSFFTSFFLSFFLLVCFSFCEWRRSVTLHLLLSYCGQELVRPPPCPRN